MYGLLFHKTAGTFSVVKLLRKKGCLFINLRLLEGMVVNSSFHEKQTLIIHS